MATNQRYTVPFRRKREGRTNYRKRRFALAGSDPRLVVRRSLNHLRIQIVKYEPKGDMVLVSASTQELAKLGWKAGTGNIPAAFLCGKLLAAKALKANIKKAVTDIGFTSPVKGSLVFAAVAGAKSGGLDVPSDEKALPKAERLSGKHIADYAALLKKDDAAYKKAFSAYLKNGITPETLPAHVKQVEEKIK